jgi:hypothetical protein
MRTIHGDVGRTAPVRAGTRTRLSEQADVGVGSGPGGPPHFAFKMFSRVRAPQGVFNGVGALLPDDRL